MTKVLSLFVFALLFSPLSHATTYDWLIKGATIIDGSGKPAYTADVGIKKKRIAFIGSADEKVTATNTVNADGRVLTPGFIDLHSHGSAVKQGAFTNFLAMGVTTISLGQDGYSPVTEGFQDWHQQWQAQGSAVNIALFVGHGSLRRSVGLNDATPASQAQILKMQQTLDKALADTFGLSTGLEYVPGLYASKNELLTLARVVRQHDRLISSHMRDENDGKLLSSIDELAHQGQAAKVHISHLKSVYGKGAERGKEILAHIESWRHKGVQITADVYPYTASYTGIAIVFPKWAKTQQQLEALSETQKEQLASYLRQRVAKRNGPQATLFGSGPYQGMTLAEAALQAGKPFEQLLIEDIGPEGASAAYFIMDAELQETLIQGPQVALSSDGSPTMHHPRGYGSFARLIQDYVIKKKLLTLPQAVHKATGLPAKILGITDRGRIAVGQNADLLLFAPDKVKATASYSQPHSLAQGFDYVWINGQLAWQQQRQTDVRAGQWLRP
ncbi:Dihydroorotase [Saliniradius amylolyticus]|uniref:Dihydroorotase n=1 Tax=Saliniradius amylolyticus TaxID=2183582 RepID=A0A2S2E3Z7_9ALTE|nr:amidohydrolase family protein [Saliniradius amylolyticus]AWL12388.1 Dihydroorotase [Saliniradius amylolyticus]